MFSYTIIFRETRDIGVQCTLGGDPLDEEPPCKRQHQLGKIFNWHIIYGSVVNFFLCSLSETRSVKQKLLRCVLEKK